MFKKLRNNMIIFNMLTLSFVILTAFSLIFATTYANTERTNERKLKEMSAIGIMPSRPFFSDKNEVIQVQERFSAEYAASFSLFIRNEEIEYINSHLDFDDNTYIEAFEKVGNSETGKISLNGRKWMFSAASMVLNGRNNYSIPDRNSYTHIVFLDITNSTEILQVLLLTLLCVGVFVMLILFFISYHFSARAVLPIEEGYNKQKQFVADASHELRTPLAIISANIDAIETSGEESVESQKEWFGYIRAELKRTAKLVGDLLYLAKAENFVPQSNLPINLSNVCEAACASMEAVLYEADISLNTEIDEGIHVIGDEEKIKQVIYILLDNAGKYTPNGGSVKVSLRKEQEKAIVQVMNSGTQIDSHERSKIFERFYRPDVSRSQETGGFGLGLSIAKTIIERIGGDISVQSTAEYTTFTICLKLS